MTISLRQEGEQIHYRIEDTGVGIVPEDYELIFTKFFRGKNARLIQPNGSGLSLSRTKDIIEDLGGTIQFFSTPGKGTIFIVTAA